MASFQEELDALMRHYTPSGGFGIPNIGALEQSMQRQSALGSRGVAASDVFRLNRSGMGRSVAAAFAPGSRMAQGYNQLLQALIDLRLRNAQLSESQRQNLLGMFSPVAEREANKPSWFSTLAGGVLGTGAQAMFPMLGNKLFGNPFQDMIRSAFSPGPASPAGYNPTATFDELSKLSRQFSLNRAMQDAKDLAFRR